MQFTGTQLTVKRSFYTQTGNFGVGLNCTLNSTTGTYWFGVSGDQGSFEFMLQSGRITQNGLFLHTYQSNREIALEAQFNTGQFNLISATTPLAFGQPKATGNYSTFYFRRASPDLSGTFNLYVTGDSFPAYTLQNQGFLTQSGQGSVTGYLLNQSLFPIRVFNSNAINPQNLAFGVLAGYVSGAASGAFAYTGDFTQFDFTQSILTTFATNFGNLSVNFNIYDVRAYRTFVTFAPIADYGFSPTNTLTRTLFYNNWSGQFQSNGFNAALNFRLDYVSGAGQFVEAGFRPVARYSITGIGSFANNGFLTGAASGVTGDSNGLSGFYSIAISQFAWATGAVSGLFSTVGSGTATGVGYSGLAVGTFTGMATGVILNGSGTLLVSGPQVGIASSATSLSYSSYTNATGYVNITGLQRGDYFYVGVQSIALTKGVQFVNETGLVAYFSGAPQHEVNSYYDGSVVQLIALASGTAGNGVFVRSGNCQAGFFTATPFLTGGANNGTTGLAVIPTSPFSGSLSFTITGSGTYSTLISGFGTGTFIYTKTFTGDWDLLTGLNAGALVSLKQPGSFNVNSISGSGNFAPNSSLVFQVAHARNPFVTEVALLTISGAGVLSGISQLLAN